MRLMSDFGSYLHGRRVRWILCSESASSSVASAPKLISLRSNFDRRVFPAYAASQRQPLLTKRPSKTGWRMLPAWRGFVFLDGLRWRRFFLCCFLCLSFLIVDVVAFVVVFVCVVVFRP